MDTTLSTGTSRKKNTSDSGFLKSKAKSIRHEFKTVKDRVRNIMDSYGVETLSRKSKLQRTGLSNMLYPVEHIPSIVSMATTENGHHMTPGSTSQLQLDDTGVARRHTKRSRNCHPQASSTLLEDINDGVPRNHSVEFWSICTDSNDVTASVETDGDSGFYGNRDSDVDMARRIENQLSTFRRNDSVDTDDGSSDSGHGDYFVRNVPRTSSTRPRCRHVGGSYMSSLGYETRCSCCSRYRNVSDTRDVLRRLKKHSKQLKSGDVSDLRILAVL